MVTHLNGPSGWKSCVWPPLKPWPECISCYVICSRCKRLNCMLSVRSRRTLVLFKLSPFPFWSRSHLIVRFLGVDRMQIGDTLKRTINLKTKVTCTEFRSINGQMVRRVKTISAAANIVEYQQVIFLILILSACQQMLTDGAYKRMVRQRVLIDLINCAFRERRTGVQLFGSQQRSRTAFKPTQMNCSRGVNDPGFRSNGLNKAGVTLNSKIVHNPSFFAC